MSMVGYVSDEFGLLAAYQSRAEKAEAKVRELEVMLRALTVDAPGTPEDSWLWCGNCDYPLMVFTGGEGHCNCEWSKALRAVLDTLLKEKP